MALPYIEAIAVRWSAYTVKYMHLLKSHNNYSHLSYFPQRKPEGDYR